MTIRIMYCLVASICLAQAIQGRDDIAKYVTVQEGDLPIIISAPHGGKLSFPGVAEREGKGVAQFTVVRDTNTELVAERLAQLIEKQWGKKPHVVIAQVERKYVDCNRPEKGAFESALMKPVYERYHGALKKFCEKVKKDYGAGILIDLHGQAADVEVIFRGTSNGKTTKLLVERHGMKALTGPSSVLGVLEKKKYRIEPMNGSDDREDMRFNGGYIVQTYGSSGDFAIDAIQLEMGGKMRSKANIEATASDLCEAISVFAKEFLPSKK